MSGQTTSSAAVRGTRILWAGALFLFMVFAGTTQAQFSTGGSQQSQSQASLTMSIEVRAWLPFIFNGTVLMNHADHDGTEIGFDRDLNIESTPEIFELGFTIGDVRYGRIVLTWCDYSVSGNKVIIRDLWYNGVLFCGPTSTAPTGETVHSEMDFAFHRLTIQTIQNFAGSYFIGLDMGVVLFDFKGELSKGTFMTPESAANPSRSARADATLPYTGLFAEFSLGSYFKLQVGLAGVFFQTTKTEVSMTEFYVRFDFYLADYILLHLGYRYQSVDALIPASGAEDGSLELLAHGLVFGIGLKI
jgi:hypothetical protein